VSGDSPSHYEVSTKRIFAIENYSEGLPRLRLKAAGMTGNRKWVAKIIWIEGHTQCHAN
jgi:hypothetical protein